MSDAVCDVFIIISCYHPNAMLTRFMNSLANVLLHVRLLTGEKTSAVDSVSMPCRGYC